MAVKIIANYSKRLGLPGYSSHQFSVSVEAQKPPKAMLLHCGAELVNSAQQYQVPTPGNNETWYPLPHSRILNEVHNQLDACGFIVTEEAHALFGKMNEKASVSGQASFWSSSSPACFWRLLPAVAHPSSPKAPYSQPFWPHSRIP
jgi:hypothetical protein